MPISLSSSIQPANTAIPLISAANGGVAAGAGLPGVSFSVADNTVLAALAALDVNGDPVYPLADGQLVRTNDDNVIHKWVALSKSFVTTTADNVFQASGASHAPGLVPDPGVTAGATKFLREDGTWQVPAGGGGGSVTPSGVSGDIQTNNGAGGLGAIAPSALPISAAQAAVNASKADLSGGKLLASQLPDLAISDFLGTVASEAAMLALVGQRGDWCVRSDAGTNWVLIADSPTLLTSWLQYSYPASPVTSVAGKTGVVTLTSSDVGLGSVDNTPDLSKPISAAVQTALNSKAATIETTLLSSAFGFVGDNATDNQTAMDAISAAALALYTADPKKHIAIQVLPGMYRFSGDWVVPPGISLDMRGAILLPTKANRDTPALTVAGKDALQVLVVANSPTQNRRFLGIHVVNAASINQTYLPTEANKRLCAAVRFKSFNDCEIDIRYINGFRIGALIWPEANSACGYVKRLSLGSFIACSVGIELRGNVSTGWANALGAIGGHFQPTSNMSDFGNCAAIVISAPPTSYTGNNELVFVSPTFEMGGTHNPWAAGTFKQTGKCVLSTTARSDGLFHIYELQVGGTPTAGNEPTHVNGGYVTTADGLLWRDLGPFYRSHVVLQGGGGGIKVTGARGETYRMASILSMHYSGWCPNLWSSGMAISVGLQAVTSATRVYQVESIGGNTTLGFAGTAGTDVPTVATATVGVNELPIGDTFTDNAGVVWRLVSSAFGNSGPVEVELTQRSGTMLVGVDRDIMDIGYGVLVPARMAKMKYIGAEEPGETVIRDIYRKAIGSATGWYIPGATWILGLSTATTFSAVSNGSGHAVLKRDSIYFPTPSSSNFPGFLIDAQNVKRFAIHCTTGQQANKVLGRHHVKAVDKNLNVITFVGGARQKVGLNTTDGNAYALPTVGTTTYGMGSPGPTNSPAVGVISADASYAFIANILGDVSSIVIKPLPDGIDTTVYPQSAPLHCPFTPMEGPRYSRGTPTAGFFQAKGEYIYNYDSAVGQPKGWFVDTAGILAPAWVTATAGILANELRVNGANVYAAQAAGTTGATPPTHTSGSVSDGTITWDYVGPVAVLTADANR